MSEKPSSDRTFYLGLGVSAAAVVIVGWLLFSTGTEETGVLTGPIASTRSSSSVSSTSNSSAPSFASTTPPVHVAPVAAPTVEKSIAPDPAQALAAAIREPDLELRRKKIMSVLREWAASDPDAAARAAMTWPGGDRVEPIAAVLAGVAGHPDEAVRLGTFFCREDPAWAPEHGRSLIAALADTGNFSSAVSFALVGGIEIDGEERNKWLITAFSGWAKSEPQLAALAATSDLPESGMQQEALIAVVANWRRLNPQGPEKFLAQLPAGRERTALANALAATSGH